MRKDLNTDEVNHLIDALMTLNTKEEYHMFFEDLFTIQELLSVSQRFEVASMLNDNKTYSEISEKTGASTATISRVNRALGYGAGGYDLVFDRLGDSI